MMVDVGCASPSRWTESRRCVSKSMDRIPQVRLQVDGPDPAGASPNRWSGFRRRLSNSTHRPEAISNNLVASDGAAAY